MSKKMRRFTKKFNLQIKKRTPKCIRRLIRTIKTKMEPRIHFINRLTDAQIEEFFSRVHSKMPSYEFIGKRVAISGDRDLGNGKIDHFLIFDFETINYPYEREWILFLYETFGNEYEMEAYKDARRNR